MSKITVMNLMEKLWCGPASIEYDSESRCGFVHMKNSTACTDMSGAIRLFLALDPGVELIVTVAAGVPDIAYRRVSGDWEPVDLKKLRRAA